MRLNTTLLLSPLLEGLLEIGCRLLLASRQPRLFAGAPQGLFPVLLAGQGDEENAIAEELAYLLIP